jgi:hypothetical protein
MIAHVGQDPKQQDGLTPSSDVNDEIGECLSATNKPSKSKKSELKSLFCEQRDCAYLRLYYTTARKSKKKSDVQIFSTLGF